MAIEIRELVIKAVVKQEITPRESKSIFQSKDAKQLKREIIDDCMDRMKEYLEDLKSR